MDLKIVEQEAQELLKAFAENVLGDWGGFSQTDGTFAVYEGRVKEIKQYCDTGFPTVNIFMERIKQNGRDNVGQPGQHID